MGKTMLLASGSPRRKKLMAEKIAKIPPIGKKQIVLASGSPRRKKLLSKIAEKFDILSAPPLRHYKAKNAKGITMEKAKFKATWAFLKNPGKICIGADTLLESGEDKIFGKPKNAKDAKKMLDKINGKSATAFTSICICSGKGGKMRIKCWTEKTIANFRAIGKRELGEYIISNKWMGKAGGFNIGEAPAKDWVKKTGGDKNTVIGLPLKRLENEIKKYEKNRRG